MTDEKFEALKQEYPMIFKSFCEISFKLHEETIRRQDRDPDHKVIYVCMANSFAYSCMLEMFNEEMNGQKAVAFFMCMIDQFIGLIEETQGIDMTDHFKTAFKSLDKFLDMTNKKESGSYDA